MQKNKDNFYIKITKGYFNKLELVGISVKWKVENGKRMNCVAFADIISVADPTLCTLRFAFCTLFDKLEFTQQTKTIDIYLQMLYHCINTIIQVR